MTTPEIPSTTAVGPAPAGPAQSRLRRFLSRAALGLFAFLAGLLVWLPLVHFVFQPNLKQYRTPEGIAPDALALARRHLNLWSDPALRAEELKKMRASNAEWDFMGRTFLVLALANMALRDPSIEQQNLAVIDAIIDETIRLERENGMYFFLMDYARSGGYLGKPERSLFIDGEIALMIGARRMVRERPDYKPLLAERVGFIMHSMQSGPALCGESYPNECWMFCNTTALAALRLSDALDGTDHSAFFRQWLDGAKKNLLHPQTGILFSSFTYNGAMLDGPEGSSIWWSAHCLMLVDPEFARDQYERARRELAMNAVGFGYAREWPRDYTGPRDIDSGPVVPVVEASAGSSGLALVAAAAFGDDAYLGRLVTTLHFAAFPSRRDGALRYCASNQVGDAAMLYAFVEGPLWRKALKGGAR